MASLLFTTTQTTLDGLRFITYSKFDDGTDTTVVRGTTPAEKFAMLKNDSTAQTAKVWSGAGATSVVAGSSATVTVT